MTPLRLMHLANHESRNIGNAALIHGLERVLAEDLTAEVEFLREDWDVYREERPFDERFVEHVNATADALLVGAAVSFDGRPIYGHTGFRFNLPLHLWERIERPIVFYGLSYRAWKTRDYHHVDALKRAFELILSSERILFSVRNDDTKEWLEGMLGYSSERILTVPDPALYVPTIGGWHPELAPGRKNVIVAVNAEDEAERWSSETDREGLGAVGLLPARLRTKLAPRPEWWKRRQRFLESLAAALDRVADDSELNIVLCPHTFADMGMSYELLLLLSERLKLRTAVASTGLPVSLGPFFYDLYAQADLAISMRIHSMNPAIGIGTPVIPVISQSRMATFMAEAGLGDLSVDVFRPDVPERLESSIRRCLDEPDDVRALLAQTRARFRERSREFNARVDAFLTAGVAAAGAR